MTDKITLAAQYRAAQLRQRLRRFKLVFIQCGAMFEPLRGSLLGELGGCLLTAESLAAGFGEVDPDSTYVVLDAVEVFAATGKTGGTTMGALREKVNKLCDRGFEVCLVSRVPRNAFAPVPGSNLLDDASAYFLPLLDEQECVEGRHNASGPTLPSVGLAETDDVDALLRDTVRQLGVNVLTELDFTIFEAKHELNFVNELDASVADALRSAGLIHIEDDERRFSPAVPLWRFTNVVADVMAEVVAPQLDLAAVSDGLWQIERTIRMRLRAAAISEADTKWRKGLLNEQLAKKVLERARSDVNVTATGVSELRDPIEWLSLGELLEVVQSARFGGLFWDSLAWKHFAKDIVPIRNRLSHMRLLKKGDLATVRMWASRVTNAKK